MHSPDPLVGAIGDPTADQDHCDQTCLLVAHVVKQPSPGPTDRRCGLPYIDPAGQRSRRGAEGDREQGNQQEPRENAGSRDGSPIRASTTRTRRRIIPLLGHLKMGEGGSRTRPWGSGLGQEVEAAPLVLDGHYGKIIDRVSHVEGGPEGVAD